MMSPVKVDNRCSNWSNYFPGGSDGRVVYQVLIYFAFPLTIVA